MPLRTYTLTLPADTLDLFCTTFTRNSKIATLLEVHLALINHVHAVHFIKACPCPQLNIHVGCIYICPRMLKKLASASVVLSVDRYTSASLGCRGRCTFYRATACNDTHSNAVAILSVHLSVTRVDCDKTKQCTVDILIPHKRAITATLTPTAVGGQHPLPSEICAQSDPPPFEKQRLWQISAYDVSALRHSEISSVMTNRKLSMGFPTSYRWECVCTLPLSPQWVTQKAIFCFCF